jgi:hypothetical protein
VTPLGRQSIEPPQRTRRELLSYWGQLTKRGKYRGLESIRRASAKAKAADHLKAGSRQRTWNRIVLE